MESNLNLSRAIMFATSAHEHQFRKGTTIPYIIHPFETALILQNENCLNDVIIAGLLHDTLEDTSLTAEIIESEFGKRTASLVVACTENKDLSWEERKNYKIDFVENTKDEDIRKIACADKLSNMRSIYIDLQSYEEDLWTRFNRGRNSQKWYYGKIIEALYPLKTLNMYQELKYLYHKVFL